jgi:DNA-binding transcriptional regulator YbjK
MIGDLLAAGPCARNCVRWKTIPRIDSLLAFCRIQNVSLTCALTERIVSNQKKEEKERSWYVHHRVPSSIVEQALRIALKSATPPPVYALASQLGYRAGATLRHRFPALCRQIAVRRLATLKVSRPPSHVTPVPRERVEKALIEALNKDGLTRLRTVAVSVGLSSTRRFYNDFRDLRLGIVTKNREIRKRQVRAIESALRAAFDEQPVPTVTEIAHRLGFACVSAVTSRFPELTAQLKARRPRVQQGKLGPPVNQNVRHRLIQALTESPPPSCSAIVRSVAGHKTQIREGSPDLWRKLRMRYLEHKQKLHFSKRQFFVADVRRVVMELHCEGIYPTRRLVLAKLSVPRFRSWNIVAEAIRLAIRELRIEPFPVCHRQA